MGVLKARVGPAWVPISANAAPSVRTGGTWRITAQSIPNSTVTYLVWTIEDADSDAMLAIPLDTVTIQGAGVYTISAGWALGVAPATQTTYIMVNGSTVVAAPGSSSGNGQAWLTRPFVIGDTVKVAVIHTQGAAANASAYLHVYRVSV